MHNTAIFQFKENRDKYGSLIPIEASRDIPFEIKRIYYIYDVKKDVTRGFHSHRQLHQMLICVNGSVSIRLKTNLEEDVVVLNAPNKGLYIGPMIWREMFDFSEGAVLLVCASEYYDESDYIRNFDFYSEEYSKKYN